MTREIKFRAVDYYTKELVYGVPVPSNSITGSSMVIELYHVDGCEYNANERTIIPETIEQFTGRYDKNGQEIYEGGE